MLMVKASRARILAWEQVALRKETATHGGSEQQTPPQEAVMTFGLPSLSYVPTTSTGAG
jgi:hypothetical protein